MTNTLNKIMHNGTEYDFPGDVQGPSSSTNENLAVFDGTTGKLIKDGGPVPTGFNPGGTATTGYVVTKTANGYEWAAPSGGDVIVSSDADNVLTTGAALRAGDETDLPANPDSNTFYFCY